MARAQDKPKKKAKKRKKRGDVAVAPTTLRVDIHLELPAAPAREPGPAPRVEEPEELDAPVRATRAAGAASPAGWSTVPPEAAPPPDAGPSWPLGPHYLRWVEGKGADAWARFKLKAADWYLSALETAEREVGLDRYVGVEMAIDGVLSSLLAGVDAAGHALADEVERCSGPPGREVPPPGADWPVVLGLAEGLGVELSCTRAVEKALQGDAADERDGWLAELRRLHGLAVRRNVLVRQPSVDGTSRNRLLDVPGLGHRPVLRYLTKASRRADAFVEVLLSEVESLGDERLGRDARPGAARRPALPNLAARADVIPSHWRPPDAH